ncbi:MAG: hypothetical protein ABI678_11345 [Kofleriaceae bacterium]
MSEPHALPGGHLSELAIECSLAGELESPAVREHLAVCAACRARREQRSSVDAQFRAAPQLAGRVDAIVAAARRDARGRTWRRAMGVAMACAAVIVATIVIRQPDGSERTRRKGGASMAIVLRDDHGRVAALATGDLAHPGDAIRFQITSPRPARVVVLAFDRRQVSVYAPVEPDHATTLDGSIVLDDTLGPERVIAVLCPRPRPLAEVLAEATAAFERAGRDPTRVDHATTCDEVHVDYLKVSP